MNNSFTTTFIIVNPQSLTQDGDIEIFFMSATHFEEEEIDLETAEEEIRK